MSDEIRMRVLLITPAMAQAWLNHAKGQNFRRIRPLRVARYARDMAHGVWHLNGEPILLDCKGLVLDGQHRLAACVRAGVPFRTVVINGVVDSTAIDGGLARTFSQHLAQDGVKSTHIMAATARLVYAWETGKLAQGLVDPSVDDLADVLARHGERFVATVKYAGHTKEVVSPTIPGAVVHIGCLNVAGPEIPEVGRTFIDGVGHGADLSKGDIRLHLRTQLMADRASPKKWLQAMKKAKIIKAWNLHATGLRGGPASIKYVPDAAFPKIYQVDPEPFGWPDNGEEETHQT